MSSDGSELCTDTFRALADSLGGIQCEGANPVGYLQNPTTLPDPTMPFVELIFVLGAVVALVDAIRRLRRDHDATWLGVWLSAVVTVLVLEPPLYFPSVFGLEDYVPAIFVHNQFTVGFLYNRLPLYILCLYPAVAYFAWAVVVRLGVATRHTGWRKVVAVAACVGFVYQCFYEIFDHFGPSHLWWAWDFSIPVTSIRVGDVPLSSIVNFATVMPAAFAVMTVLVLQRKPRTTARSVVLPAIAVGALSPIVSAPGQMPISIMDIVESTPKWLVVAMVSAILAAAAAITLREVLAAYRAPVPGDTSYVVWAGAVYLATFTIFYAADGDKVPTAGWIWATGCWVICLGIVITLRKAGKVSR